MSVRRNAGKGARPTLRSSEARLPPQTGVRSATEKATSAARHTEQAEVPHWPGSPSVTASSFPQHSPGEGGGGNRERSGVDQCGRQAKAGSWIGGTRAPGSWICSPGCSNSMRKNRNGRNELSARKRIQRHFFRRKADRREKPKGFARDVKCDPNVWNTRWNTMSV